jgi:integrase/recombinase XerC
MGKTAAAVNQYFSGNQSRFAKETVRRYRRVLESLFAACQKEYDQVKADDIRRWAGDRKDRGIKEHTVTKDLVGLRSFYGYCLEQGLTGANPFLSEPPERCLERTDAAVGRYFSDNQSRFAPGVIKRLRSPLRNFFAFSRKEYDQVEADDIRRWVVERKSKGIKDVSINKDLATLRAFYNYCLQTGLAGANPVIDIEHHPPKSSSPQISIFEELPDKTAAILRQFFSDNPFQFARSTISHVRYVLKGLFVTCQKEYDEIRVADIACWMEERKNRGIKHETIINDLTGPRAFFSYCLENGLVGENPVSLKRPPQIAMKKTANTVDLYFADHQPRFAQGTIRHRRSSLKKFFALCRKEYDRVRAVDIQRWVDEQKNEGIRDYSIRKNLNVLRAFYSHCLKSGLVRTNPVLKVEPPPLKRSSPRIKSVWGEVGAKTANTVDLYFADHQPRLSQGTIRRQRCLFKSFFSFCRKEYDQVSSPDAQRWLEERKNMGNKCSTVMYGLVVLRLFYRYCLEKGLIGENIFLSVAPPYPKKCSPQADSWGEALPKTANAVQQYFLDNQFRLVRETVRRDRYTFNNFFSFCQKEYDQVLAADIRHWMEERKNKIKNSTIRLELVRLRSFYSYCQEEDLTPGNPASSVEPPKLVKSPPIYLEKSQLARLREATRVCPRERTIVETLYTTGVRVNELCRLKKEDVDWETRLITVWDGKGMKDRIVLFTAECAERLKMYLALRQDESPYLFLSELGLPLKPSKVEHYFRCISRRLGFRVWPHLLRHTFAAHLAQKGMPLSAIQELLGHDDIKNTEIYTELYAHARKDQYDKYC